MLWINVTYKYDITMSNYDQIKCLVEKILSYNILKLNIKILILITWNNWVKMKYLVLKYYLNV